MESIDLCSRCHSSFPLTSGEPPRLYNIAENPWLRQPDAVHTTLVPQLNELASIRTEIAQVESVLASLRSRETRLEDCVNSHETLVKALIYMLPDDVLRDQIFRLVWEDADNSSFCINNAHERHPAFVLSYVCSRWRRVSLGYPRLWSRFEVRIRSDTAEDNVRRISFLVETFLARSRGSLLDVALHSPQVNRKVALELEPEDVDLLLPIHTRLLREAKRWHKMTLAAHKTNLIDWFSSWSTIIFSNLKCLKLIIAGFSSGFIHFPLSNHAVPRLQSLTLVGDWETFGLGSTSSPTISSIATLQRLSIRCPGVCDMDVGLFSLASSSSTVTLSGLWTVPLVDDDFTDEELRISCPARELIVDPFSHFDEGNKLSEMLGRLDAPNLEALTIAPISERYTTRCIAFPYESLMMLSRRHPDTSRITSLTLRGLLFRNVTNLLQLLACLSGLTHLSVYVPDHLLLERIFSTYKFPFDNKFFLALNFNSHQSNLELGFGSVVLPKLQDFFIEVDAIQDIHRDSLFSMLESRMDVHPEFDGGLECLRSAKIYSDGETELSPAEYHRIAQLRTRGLQLDFLPGDFHVVLAD
ncbi:hypothetical protein VKT23_011865 [Stygiomarasmius scandens]|uniref:F-box domain-containing protein n=1 Tax=Marasmiellus scandens TaxID=2682957 RepID=A0ABR1JC74_9AGAR